MKLSTWSFGLPYSSVKNWEFDYKYWFLDYSSKIRTWTWFRNETKITNQVTLHKSYPRIGRKTSTKLFAVEKVNKCEEPDVLNRAGTNPVPSKQFTNIYPLQIPSSKLNSQTNKSITRVEPIQSYARIFDNFNINYQNCNNLDVTPKRYSHTESHTIMRDSSPRKSQKVNTVVTSTIYLLC